MEPLTITLPYTDGPHKVILEVPMGQNISNIAFYPIGSAGTYDPLHAYSVFTVTFE